jgi:hypothetical protein
MVVLLLRRHLQLRREDLEHHLHVLVSTGLHLLVKLQYAAAAACFISEIRIFVTVMDRRKGKRKCDGDAPFVLHFGPFGRGRKSGCGIC